MELRFERAILGSLACRHRFVNDGDRAVNIAGAGFGFGKRNLEEPVEEQDVLLAQKLDPAAHVLEAAAGWAALRAGQTLEKDPIRPPRRQIVLPRESDEFIGVQRYARKVAEH